MGRLPLHTPHPKQNTLHHHVHHHQLDILGISEVGLNWPLLPQSSSWHERTYKAFRQQSSILSWNQQDIKTAATQWGGTALITTGLTTSRIHLHGKDPRQLGRWCWTKYTGKSNTILTIYSIYKPIKNLHGPLSVYQQHRNHLSCTASHNIDPLKSFDKDLVKELQQCLSQGEHLLIGGDLNEEISHSTLATAFLQLGLQEAILSHHDNAVPSLSTHIRNDCNRIIDGIWKTPALVIRRSGYTSFSTWDHRTAWIDLDTTSAFGISHKNITQRASRAAAFNCLIQTLYTDIWRIWSQPQRTYNFSPVPEL